MLEQLLRDVRGRRSRVLVLRGEAGVGKTALMDYVARASAGCRVVRAAGIESEVELAFAGVHQLCSPLLDHIDGLPDPQRIAIGTAFGLVAGEAADRFLVGLAVLSLLSAAAEQEPLVCLIEDAQWLDQVSAQILAFVARRLLAESVALVFAVREPSDPRELDGLPDQRVSGLGIGDARALLDSALPARLDRQVRDRIIDETRGNPLALLELPRGSTAGELAGGFAIPAARPLAGQIELGFLRRVRRLPEGTQQLVLLAAAEPTGDPLLVQRAAAVLGFGAEDLHPAEDEGLIDVGPRVRFRHPLVRSAVYGAGSVADRRAAHRALAEVTDRQRDPDRRAWHRAQAAAEPDDDVAAELERSAARARSRGGIGAAAAFLELAANLSADPALRGARALAAAHAKFESAAYDDADRLIAMAASGPVDAVVQARLARLRAQIVFARNRGREAPPLFLDAAQQLERIDDPLARDTYLEALGAAIFAGRSSIQPTLGEIARAARATAVDPAMARVTDALLDGLATRFTDGYVAAVAPLRDAVEQCRRHLADADAAATRWFGLAWLVAGELWDDGLQEELATRAVRLCRNRGALGQLPLALVYRAGVHINAGELDAASALVDEADAITASTGDALLGYGSAVLAVWRGDVAAVEQQFARLMENAGERGEGRGFVQGDYTWAILANGLGRYDEAHVRARAACADDVLGVRGFALVELVEAAVRVGALDEAAEALRDLEERTLAAGTDWALGIRARSRALLADGEAADGLYREAIDRLGRSRIVVHLARAHLLYGEWLRQEQRRTEARAHLRIAHDRFEAMGAQAFAERARAELAATGETARQRSAHAAADLTPQEAQIAHLAAEGRTNPEIGSELFISPRTVEYHLGKVYGKLGVGSRRELRRSLER